MKLSNMRIFLISVLSMVVVAITVIILVVTGIIHWVIGLIIFVAMASAGYFIIYRLFSKNK